MCVTLAKAAILLRHLAGRMMPANHPLRAFEDDCTKMLKDAELKWFRNRTSG